MRAEESKKPDKRRYKTTNWREYNKALKARGSLSVWLDTDMQWLAPPTGKRGRRPTFSDASIQFCLSIKCLFGLALRQALGFVHSLLRLAGLQWPVPDYSTLSRRQQTLKVQLPYRPRTTALDLLVDSTGIKFLGEGEWKRKKHGAEYRRQWRKVHLGIDAQTLEIRAIEVTDNSVGDAPVLPHLLAQIPPDEKLASVSADGAYDTKGTCSPSRYPDRSGASSGVKVNVLGHERGRRLPRQPRLHAIAHILKSGATLHRTGLHR